MNRFGNSRTELGLIAVLLIAGVGVCGFSASGSDMGEFGPIVGQDIWTRNRTRPINLGSAANFAILSKTGISNVPGSEITGNLGVSPISSTAVTGLALSLDASGTFSTSAQVIGRIYAADYRRPTPRNLTIAIGDMQLAYTEAAGRSAGVTELGGGDIGGLVLRPGVYKWSTGVIIPTSVTLRGNSSDVWIFQIAQRLTQSSATEVILSGGAQAKNVFWQVAGGVAIDTTAHMEGVVMSQTAITLNTGASINGRLLAQTAVTLIHNKVVQK